MRYVFVLLTVALFGCHDNCKSESTRCQDDQVQICNSEGDWETVIDCVDVEPGLWECCEDYFDYDGELLTSCVPLDTCESDAGTDGGGL